MKKLFLYSLALFVISCGQTESYKSIRQDVLERHDKIMIDTELAFRNKMKLDTFASRLDSLKKVQPDLDTVKERSQINILRTQLNDADNQMNNWMHQFEAEKGQKSNTEAVAYFNAEKEKVDSLDRLFKRLLKQSDEYLKRMGKKSR
ncbi:MAG: hypothetical protein ACYCZO_02100 [Daejeonella sp.]